MNSTSSLWELAAKTSQLGFLCWDIQTNAINWSDNIKYVLNCSSDDLSNQFEEYCTMIYLPDRARVLKVIQESIDQKIDYQIDYRIVLSNGEQCWIEQHGTTILSDSGEVIQLLGTVRNVTTRKEAERRSSKNEYLFQLVMDNIPSFIFWKDRNSVLQGCNQNFAEIAGFNSPEEIVGKTDYDGAWKKEEADFFRKVDRRVMESGRAELNIIEPQLQASGKQAWLTTDKIPLHDETGQVIGLLGMFTDITEKIEAQQAEQRANRENALLAAAVANAPVGISITDPSLTDDPIVFVNPTFLSMTGYSEEDFIGHNCRFLQGEDTNPETIVKIRKAITEKKPITTEILNYRKDGRKFWNLLTITPLFDENGEHTHFIGMQTDITERKKNEALMEQAKEAAETANQAKSDFIANMSHELRTPLNGILGYAQMLRYDEGLTARQKQSIETIYRSGDHLLSLVDHILNFSSLDAGEGALHLTRFDLESLLNDLVKTARLKSEQKNISFLHEKDNRLPRGIRADKRYLHQVLSNLLDNAIKFTKEGQVRFNVRMIEINRSLPVTKEVRLRFEIIDTGVGIRDELLTTIFQPFEQLGTLIERADGAGLGLAITLQLVKLMGGQIKVESTVGQGSRFWFDLSFQVAEVSQIKSDSQDITSLVDQINDGDHSGLRSSEDMLTELLVTPPQTVLEKLYDAATLGKMSQIRKQMKEIEQVDAKYTPFANKVRELVWGFEDDKILALVEEHLQTQVN